MGPIVRAEYRKPGVRRLRYAGSVKYTNQYYRTFKAASLFGAPSFCGLNRLCFFRTSSLSSLLNLRYFFPWYQILKNHSRLYHGY